MRVQMVGISHHNSPVAIRERLAFTPEQTRQALEAWRQSFPDAEAVLLSTCNRVEIYTAGERAGAVPSHESVVEFLAAFHHLPAYEVFDDLFQRTGDDAVRHLFTVAASLDSMVVGEPQILAQVKQAYQLATEQSSTGPLTHGVFQAAVKTARRISAETTIHQRRVSIPSIAVSDFASQIFEGFSDKNVLMIGSGKISRETLRYLCEQGAQNISVIGRDLQRAQAFATPWNAVALEWNQLESALVEADVVISATGAPEPIIDARRFREAVHSRRNQRSLFVLDLAMPRDFDPAIGNELGVYLYCIDDLTQVCQRNRQLRDQELPAALRIVEEETSRFMAELSHRSTAPIIRRLREDWEGTKNRELDRLMNKLSHLDDRGRDEIRLAFDRLVNKLLHPPLQSLRDEASEGTSHGLLDALKRLFRIHDDR